MTSVAQLRKAALRLPETEEGTHFGMVAFSVRGKGFASVTSDGLVQLQLPEEDVRAFLSEHSAGEPLVRMGTQIGLRVPLDDVNGKVLNALVRAAWAHRAPKRLAAKVQAAGDPSPRGDDLPVAISSPARRAPQAAGVTTLDQVATWSEAELLALHGVGPRAIRILADSLTERGLSLR